MWQFEGLGVKRCRIQALGPKARVLDYTCNFARFSRRVIILTTTKMEICMYIYKAMIGILFYFQGLRNEINGESG